MSDPVSPLTLEWLFNMVLSALLALTGFILKMLHGKAEKTREMADEHTVELAQLKATAVSEQRIRDIVVAQVIPLAAAHADIFLELKKLNTQVSDMRVEIAKRDSRHNDN